MWFFMNNQTRIFISKMSAKQQIQHRFLRQFFKPGSHKRLNVIPRKQPNLPDLVAPTIFTVGFCSLSLTGGLIWQYENIRYAQQHKENPFTKFFRNMPPAGSADYKDKHNIVCFLIFTNTGMLLS